MLFSKAKIRGVRIKNRLIALPLFTGYALPDARVSPLMIEHYRRLARSGAAVVVVPNVAVAENGRTSERSLLIEDDKYLEGLSRLAKVIKEAGAVASAQLNHAGRYAATDHPLLPSAIDSNEIKSSLATLKNFMESFPLAKRFKLTARVSKMTAGWTYEMTEDDIRGTIARFAEAASRAVQAGFDMIEIHGATGYLVTQFLSARTNRRSPPWGGSAENRVRFPLKIVSEIRRKLPARVPISFRLILDEKMENGISAPEAITFAVKLEQHGVDCLSATAGTYQSMFTPAVAKQLARPGYLTGLTRRLKAHVNIPVVVSGRIVSPAQADRILQSGAADLIGLGRALLADSDWIHRAVKNEKSIACKNCNTCFRQVALGESVACERWPKVVKDRIKLETRFTSRHGYRTLTVLFSQADLDIAKTHVRERILIHQDIYARQLFFIPDEKDGFVQAAQAYARWSDRYLRLHLKRGRVENVFVSGNRDPVALIMTHLQENFGFVIIFHDDTSPWKRQLVLKAPADVAVVRCSVHPNMKKVLVPCDLSPFTLMQTRVAAHAFHGRPDVDFRFVHVTRDPEKALKKWTRMIQYFKMPNTPVDLKVIPADRRSTVAGALLQEAKKGQYGSVIIGRRGGAARVRRRMLGSVSEQLLNELPECSFFIIG